MSYIVFTLFIISLIFTGLIIVYRWFGFIHLPLLKLTASLIVGIMTGITATYFLCAALIHTPAPIWYGCFIYSILIFLLLAGSAQLRSDIGSFIRDLRKISWFEAVLTLTIWLFSYWLMAKTLKTAGGLIFTGSNEVFDFGHSLALVRSFSWGNNLPFSSPFIAGENHLYHFMFYFFSAIFEYFGFPIDLAVNIPSAISFSLLLLLIYFLPQIVFNQKSRLLGLLSLLLAVTHSTLGFFIYIFNRGLSGSVFMEIWNMPKYLFAGPYDGSPISIHWTLNVFVNQRHLALGISTVLLVYLILILNRNSAKITLTGYLGIGLLVTVSAYWHIVMWAVLFGGVLIFLLYRRKYRLTVYLLLGQILALPALWLWCKALILYLYQGQGSISLPAYSNTGFYQLFSAAALNLGLSLVTVPFGFWLLSVKSRKYFAAPAFVLIVTYLLSLAGLNIIEQKLMNLLIIFADLLSAYAVWSIWKRGWGYRVISVILLFFLTASGLMDLSVIKNDFQYPLVDGKTAQLIAWIKDNTAKGEIILSYPDIVDPVALSGRRNFNGFYRNILQAKRDADERQLIKHPETNRSLYHHYGIRYVIFPKQKNDYSYADNLGDWQARYRAVYSDSKHAVFLIN